MILYAGYLEVNKIKYELKEVSEQNLMEFEKLRVSLLQWGILDPLICISYKEDPIVAYIGQQRLKLAKELGIKWVRVILFDWNKAPGSWVSYNSGKEIKTICELEDLFIDKYAWGCFFLREIMKNKEDLVH